MYDKPERTTYTVLYVRTDATGENATSLASGYGYEMEFPELVPKPVKKDDAARNPKLY